MAKNQIILLFIFFQNIAFGQLSFVEESHDFGTLRRADPNWVDFKLVNSTDKDAVIFRVESSKNIDSKISKKSISPNEAGLIRVAISPSAEGKFKEELLVYASSWNTPKKIFVQGNSTFASSSLIPCPDFDGGGNSTSNEFFFSVRKPEISEAIQSANIRVYKDARRVNELRTNEYGEASLNLPYGRYFFAIEYGNSRIDTALYVNAVNNHLLAILENTEPEIIMPSQTEDIREEDVSELDSEKQLSKLPEPPTSLDSTDKGPLPLSEFKLNNLVFLVDVSSSMKKNGKLDLLKIAMIELLEVLREVDRFSLISYASDTDILMETHGNLDREACIRTIMSLEAKGSTAGAEAINKAGKLAVSNYVIEGNNQIILATDGAFNEGVGRAARIAKKFKKMDVSLSVVGIKCAPYVIEQMEELVANSGGRFIPIRTDFEAGDQLIEEIKKSSQR